jgi:hypothetical protein
MSACCPLPVCRTVELNGFGVGVVGRRALPLPSCQSVGCHTHPPLHVDLGPILVLPDPEPCCSRDPCSSTARAPSAYFCVAHGSVFRILLENRHASRCDAEVFVHRAGVAKYLVGTYRVPADSDLLVEHPADTSNAFVFTGNDPDTLKIVDTLITVVFYPECPPHCPPAPCFEWSTGSCHGGNGCLPGVLNGYAPMLFSAPPHLYHPQCPPHVQQHHQRLHEQVQSWQELTPVKELCSIDASNVTEIQIRLIAREACGVNARRNVPPACSNVPCPPPPPPTGSSGPCGPTGPAHWSSHVPH